MRLVEVSFPLEGMRQGAGGARIASNSIIILALNYFLCVKFRCHFLGLNKRDPDVMERVAQTPNKVHPPTLNTILHLAYVFWLQNRMLGEEIKPQSQRSQKRAQVPEAVFYLY